MKFDFERFCMMQAVRLRNFCFWPVVKRHFAKEFGDLEWQEMPGIQFEAQEQGLLLITSLNDHDRKIACSVV